MKFKPIIRIMNIFLYTAFIFGCALSAKGPLFSNINTPNDGKSIVYFYRVNSQVGLWAAPVIHDNDKPVSPGLVVGSYWPYISEPGIHKFNTDTFSVINEVLMLKTEANKVYFVKLNINHIFLRDIWVPTLVDREMALLELPFLRQVE